MTEVEVWDLQRRLHQKELENLQLQFELLRRMFGEKQAEIQNHEGRKPTPPVEQPGDTKS